MSYGVGCRYGSDPMQLWLKPAAVTQMRPLAWEPPYDMSAAPPKNIFLLQLIYSVLSISAVQSQPVNLFKSITNVNNSPLVSQALLPSLPRVTKPPGISICFISHSFTLFFFFFFFFGFQSCICSIWKFPGQGSNLSYSCGPTPQPPQQIIRAASATYSSQ